MEVGEAAQGLAAGPLGMLRTIPASLSPGAAPSRDISPPPEACQQPSLTLAFPSSPLCPFLLHPDSSAYQEWLPFPDK